jgi:hypothetical protein
MQPYAPDIGVITAMYPDGVQVMASSFHKPDGTQGILLSCASLKQDQAEARCKEVERQYLSQR